MCLTRKARSNDEKPASGGFFFDHAILSLIVRSGKAREPTTEDSVDGSEFLIRHASWERDQAALRAVRQQVFIEEQAVPAALEWDEIDAEAVHLLAVTPSGGRAMRMTVDPSALIREAPAAELQP